MEKNLLSCISSFFNNFEVRLFRKVLSWRLLDSFLLLHVHINSSLDEILILSSILIYFLSVFSPEHAYEMKNKIYSERIHKFHLCINVESKHYLCTNICKMFACTLLKWIIYAYIDDKWVLKSSQPYQSGF